ncbi:MAG: hypothetical protein R3362_09285 [Rhodothermales bacterium]|nr:hypothetical protein [Rhodothermales bacterium]
MNHLPLALLAVLLAAPATAQSFTGTLGPESARRDFGEPYAIHEFDAEQGQAVTIDLTSDAFDTYLIVRSPSGMEWVNDDYDFATDRSHVELVAPEAGTWQVYASAFDEAAAGAYALEVTLGEVAEIETVPGRLEFTDPQLVKGEFVDTFTIDPPDAGTFTVELLAQGFDGFLRVTAPSGAQWRNDDAEGASDASISRVRDLPAEPGEWTVDVTSYGAEETGDYVVNLIVPPQEEEAE